MSLSDKAKSFRLERASELDQFARAIRKMDICDPGPLFEAVAQIRNFDFVPKIEQGDAVNYDFWGYYIPNLTFYFTTTPRHTYPEDVTGLTLNLSIKLISDYKDFGLIKDPFKLLEFNVVLQGNRYDEVGNAKELITSLHLDRHISSPQDGEPEDIHPIYHFQFGGRKLNKKYKDFGDSLILDSPRIVHYPMDIILGIDFILANFFSNKWKEARQDGEYSNLVKGCQANFWKPYAHSKASHWKPFDDGNIAWSPLTIWPNLLID